MRDTTFANFANTASADATLSTLDSITNRISNAARQAREIGIKLNEHANAVHGPVPQPSLGMNKPEEMDQPRAALDRIYQALDDLDRQQSYMAEAAGRNTTLAY